MKNRLTKLSIFLSLIIGMLFASCGSGTPEMHTVECVQRVVDVYTKCIDTDKYKPISIRYTEKGKLTN